MTVPFPYHIQVRDYLKNETKSWSWFASNKIQEEAATSLKEELLKNTYRLSPESENNIYEIVEKCKQKLGIEIPITVYQSMHTEDNNAGISYLGNEAHLVLTGGILKILNQTELTALIAHELGHILFFTYQQNEFEISHRTLNTFANDSNSPITYYETARIFQLYMELFCDRISYEIVEDENVVISTLVKLSTGLEKVSAANYLAQADEILNKKITALGDTHPEMYIRAKSIFWYATNKELGLVEIPKLIEGNMSLENMDLFMQKKITENTKYFLQLLTKPKWMRTEMIHNLCVQYFPDFQYKDEVMFSAEKQLEFSNYSSSVKKYFSFILLDIAWVDDSLEDAPLGFVLDFAEHFELKKELETAIKKEKNLTDKQLKSLLQNAIKSLTKIPESISESIFESNP